MLEIMTILQSGHSLSFLMPAETRCKSLQLYSLLTFPKLLGCDPTLTAPHVPNWATCSLTELAPWAIFPQNSNDADKNCEVSEQKLIIGNSGLERNSPNKVCPQAGSSP